MTRDEITSEFWHHTDGAINAMADEIVKLRRLQAPERTGKRCPVCGVRDCALAPGER